jgi:glutaredoxin
VLAVIVSGAVTATVALAALASALAHHPPSDAPSIGAEPVEPVPTTTPLSSSPSPPETASKKRSGFVSATPDERSERLALAEEAARVQAERTARTRALQRQQAEFEEWAHREAMKSVAEDEARARRTNGGPTAPDSFAAQSGATNQRSGVSEAARSSVSITMYSASWCGVCSAARAYMTGARIPFIERDVDTDSSAALEARQRNPRGTVPTFDIGGLTLIGFSPRSLERTIDAAAARQ